MVLCPVRDCHMPLERTERQVSCSRGHSFDVARSGYINLLQPQERRSKQPGDTAAAVAARRRLHDRGVTEPLLCAIADMIAARPNDIVLDAGCGDGFYLGSLARQAGFEAHGVDISTRAVDLAARRYPPSQELPRTTHGGPSPLAAAALEHVSRATQGDIGPVRAPQGNFEWIVANADRFIPYADRSFSIILSITARMNSGEFRRVLRDDGMLLVALPAPDDLIELRSHAGQPGPSRVARTVETFAEHFTLVDQRHAATVADLDASAVHDVLLSIYRPMRAQPAEAMRVTFSLDLLLFRPA